MLVIVRKTQSEPASNLAGRESDHAKPSHVKTTELRIPRQGFKVQTFRCRI